ncbi:MAG: hypothetical protein KGL39_14170 [Patescibacteria group bacterium]|nr:hypothetical protein [Patescibacteria group bacterium]
MTAQDIINAALRKIGAIATGESPTSTESSDALETLNDLVDSWNTQRLAIYTTNRQVFNFTAGKATYTYGTGGDFNAARPVRIDRVSVITNSNPSQPLELPIAYLTVGEWQQTPVKNVPSSLPFRVYDDGSFPLRNLTFWPNPTDGTVQACLYPWAQLTEFADLVTDYQFPQGYARALKYALALELAPEFGVTQINPVIVQGAAESLAKIKALNSDAATEPLYCDPAITNGVGGIYDWRTGNMIRRTN